MNVPRLKLAALMLVMMAPGFAQTIAPQNTAAIFIKGSVKDTQGAAIAGATVTLEEKTRSESVEGKADNDGKFSFLALKAGTYVVRATMAGFRKAVTDPMQLSPGDKKQIDLVLKILDIGGPGTVQPEPVAPGTSAVVAQHAAPEKPQDAMEFSDVPNFSVAGVTDWNNVGLHASETNARTSEALAKETAALKASGANAASDTAEERARHAVPLPENASAEMHRKAGDAYEKAGEPLKAEQEYEAAARLDPSEENTFAWGTELLVHRAIAPAVEVFSKGVEAHGDSARMRIGLGAALYSGGSTQEAARRVCEASDLQPADTVPYFFLGEMQQSAADSLSCVEEKLARFVRQQPENALANYYYAIALWKKTRGAENSADFQRQEALLQKAARCDPKLAEAYVQLGILYAGQGGYEQATRAYKQAIAVNPDLAEAHYRLSLAYKRLGNATKAEQEFALYKKAQEAESAATERQRKDLQQFVVKEKDKEKKD